MGEGGNLNKWFVGIFVFIGIFGIFLSTVPSIFQSLGVTASVTEKEAVAVFTVHNITMYNQTLSVDLDQDAEYFSSYGLPSPQRLHFYWFYSYPNWVIGITHQIAKIGGYWYSYERLDVQEPYLSLKETSYVAYTLEEEDIVTNLFDAELNATYVEMASSRIALNLMIRPRSNGSTIQQAWDAGELTLYTSYDVDWTKTGESMWNIMFQILAFQTPTLGISGTFGLILTRALSFTLWAMIGVLAYALVTAVIPTVSGWRG